MNTERLKELRAKYRKDPRDEAWESVANGNFLPPEPLIPRKKFQIGDEVYVRCKVIGPAMLAYDVECIVLDLTPIDSNGEATGGRFTATPNEAFTEWELMPYA